MTAEDDALTASIQRAWSSALADFDLAGRVRAALIGTERDKAKPLRAFAVGKAALAMMEGALDAGVGYCEAIVVVPEGSNDARSVIARAGATMLVGSHPIPDDRSERAGRAVLALAARAAIEGGTIHAFVSGGASALACVPCGGVDVATKAGVTRALLASGADVRAINTVRRHLSVLKGGGVLRASAPAAVHTFVVSDVLGGELHDVGSGPSVVDPTTIDDARRVLARFAPELAALPLIETTKPNDVAGRCIRTTVVADARDFAAHVRSKLAVEGFSVAEDEHALEISVAAEVLAIEILDAAARLGEGEALVRCVEPSLVVTANRGGGGRASHVAAMVASRLPEGVACLVGSTDGVDGGSGTGGAIVTVRTAERAGPSLATAIEQFSAAASLGSVGATLLFGPTGLNFADVVIVARA